jgi:hypothetical protein
MKKHIHGLLLRFSNQTAVVKKEGQVRWNVKGEMVIFFCCENHVERELDPRLLALLRQVLQLLGKMSAWKCREPYPKPERLTQHANAPAHTAYSV